MSGKGARPSVAVTIVTYNSAKYIGHCLESVFAQDYAALQVIVIDNASVDATRLELQPFEHRITLVLNRENAGFAAGQNQAMALSNTDWVLTLNPDVRLGASFVSELVAAAEADPEVGSACGKLLRMAPDCEIPKQNVFDSTGIFFTPNLRHFDRGSGMADDGRFDRYEYVFGATGAAALYRRKMIDDVSYEGEFFDCDFFAYREDTDVAWRAQLLGWKCLYTPRAIAYHVRSVLPENRRSLPAVINMHSVKNRFLMRIKNATLDLYRRFWFPITVRDCVVIGGCLLYEFRSLRAFPLILRGLSRTRLKRRDIMRRRRATDEYIARWFSRQPVSYPAAAPPYSSNFVVTTPCGSDAHRSAGHSRHSG
ncbi:MAG: glycosyltransferase family 2 protein [Acidobacteriaceae bacterium]|nr:glycosyltransferase family 2 protein [Acidobacteriaceae bacterium]